MSRKAPGIRPADPPPPPLPKDHDAGAMIYKDRSGAARGGVLSEGRDNFGAIVAEAQKTVALAKESDDA